MLPFFGDMHQHRDVGAGVFKVAFATWGDATVIAVIENDGVFIEPVGGEVVEDFSDLGIEVGNDVVVVGNVAANAREIGKVGAECDFGGIESGFARFLLTVKQ